MTNNLLQNKTALITGANSGIGLATAKLFAQQGAKVIITGRKEDALQKAIAEIGHQAQYIVSDAGDLQQNLSIRQQLADKGITALDILFFNAGVGQYAPVEQTSVELFDNNMNINFRGAFFTTQSVLPIFNNGGSIIFNGSLLANVTMPGNGAYGASKASLVSLGKTLALELADRNIRANTLSPGAINTPIYGKLGMTEEQLNAFAGSFIPKIAAARFGEADEMAKAALFLASDMSSYVNGTELLADGGASYKF
jgi:NAD(P)-dependent dehydrogenase (short-subunit alcohol dehydrogenase family)